ncbi:MAG: transcriptional repressor [Bacteroidales bacterium]|nr:transcriptional repressor [Bacteroidales bacterium]
MRRSHSAPDMESFRSILKSKGLKATPQRLAVHEAMLSLGHACADMVCEQIRKSGNACVTVASVYNILSGLSTIGIYRRIPTIDNRVWYDVLTRPHLHIYDRKRNEIKDLSDEDFASVATAYFKEHSPKGYKVDEIDIQLVCHRSRNSKKL